jgi:DMSO/TMAO reductase YedYZ molybdopterin-dependent catalytic subunit
MAILSTRLEGERLSVERGAPCRLVVAHPACELSMKWIERLELCTKAEDQPAGPRKPPA